MIIVKLIGGLGNQCFQYAVGRHLAELRKTELKLDISEFENYKLHNYALGKFNIIENFALPEEIKVAKYIKERHFHFDPQVFDVPDEAYLNGYWQSEKYFKDISEIIRKELTVKEPLLDKNKEVFKEIDSCISVSLHIRRTDYLNSNIHVPCGLEYYMNAVKFFLDIEEKTHFFVFTDDKEWVRKNFKLNCQFTIVEHNDSDKNYEDLRLMTFCKHNIIANSTFSWWGAWLNTNPDKRVLAPSKWFNDKAYSNSKDVIPSAWLKT